MPISSWLSLLRQQPVIAVIRSPEMYLGQQMAMAVAQGGMQLIEVTWNSDRPAELISWLRTTLPACQIGAGTLLNQAQVKAAIAAGAQFLFTPHVAPDLIDLAVAQDVPIVAGALSPTEIVQAWQAGATCVKVFPVQAMGGTEYIKSLQGPLGHIPLIPTGGVMVGNAIEFLQAGAIAVGIAGNLFPPGAIEQRQWEKITHQARTLIHSLTALAPVR